MLNKAKVRDRLASLGLEDKAAAERMGITKQAFYNIMKGTGVIRSDTLYALAEALECAPCDLLLGGTKTPKPKKGGKR